MAVVAAVGLVSGVLAGLDTIDAFTGLGLIPDVLVGFYGPLTRAWEFAAGALLALALHHAPAVPQRTAQVSGIVGSIGLLTSMWMITESTEFPGPWTMLPVTATVLLLVAGSGESTAISRALSTRPMTTIGDLSYSIYLWHWPFIVFARATWDDDPVAIAVAAAVSVIPAYASYRWLEQPIRNMNVIGPRQFVRLVAATLVTPLALSAGLAYAADRSFWSATVKAYRSAAFEKPAHAKAGCDKFGAGGARSSFDECTWNSAAAGEPIYLIGDSNAGQFGEAVIGAGDASGRAVVVATLNSCPFVLGYLDWPAIGRPAAERCHAQVRSTLTQLQSASPGDVVLAATDRYWLEPDFAFGSTSGTVTNDTAGKLATLEANLTTTVTALQQAGHRVLMVQTIPRNSQPHRWKPEECSLLDMLTAGCGNAMPLHTAEDYQAGPRAAVTAVGQRTGAGVLDLGPTLCPGGICSVHAVGFIRMKDATHISVTQSEALAPVFEAALSTTSRQQESDNTWSTRPR